MKMQLSKWQSEYINHFDDDLYIAMTGISSGKTHILAIWLVLQCLKKPGIRGIIIAQNYRALSKVLIREIELVATQMNVPVLINKASMEIKFSNDSILFGYSAENPNAVLGLTEIAILAIDEAAYCNEEIYNNAKDRMRGSKYNSMTRLISSPQSMAISNYFSALCKKYPDKVIHATAFDNPFTSDSFKNELRERYGEGSNLYRQQVLGELFDTDIATQIIKRAEFVLAKDNKLSDKFYFGYDASGLGADNDIFTVIDEYGVVSYEKRNDSDTIEKVGIISNMYNTFNILGGFADGTGGYSIGTTDLLLTKNINITPINFAQKAFNSELYPNARTEMYIEAANTIRHGFWVPEEAKAEFIAQQTVINSKGQIQLVPKDNVKRIIGHSPDLADSIALAIYAMNHYNTANVLKSKEEEAKHASEIADKYLRLFNQFNTLN